MEAQLLPQGIQPFLHLPQFGDEPIQSFPGLEPVGNAADTQPCAARDGIQRCVVIQITPYCLIKILYRHRLDPAAFQCLGNGVRRHGRVDPLQLHRTAAQAPELAEGLHDLGLVQKQRF